MGADMQSHTLQQVYAPRLQSVASLYLHCQGDVAVSDQSVALGRGGRLSTNSYFNSFYAGYWRRFADIGSLGVHVTFTGHLRITVHSCCERHGEREIVSKLVDAQGPSTADTTLWLDPGSAGVEGGRIYVVIEAMGPGELRSIAYVTDAQPRQEVSLSVGICTFNREMQLEALLTELLAECDRNAAVRQVCVVNQGAAFASDELKVVVGDDRLKLIEQANLGGCGGFNRTIYEALKAERASTHHLLMDDDVRLDARLLETVAAFLRYAENDLVLGGHMLRTDRETLLLEAGAVFDPVWFVKPVGKGTDLAEPANLGAFERYRPVDYNGWWFCALPVRQMERAGYSPPVFIRCDDMEYGCRMSKQGVPTVPLPGVAVWHDLNFSHASDWDQYYDIRNRLILSTMHSDMTAQPGPHFVFGYMVECLLTHRYGAARMCMAGIGDFLLGPDALFAVDPAERHSRVMQQAAAIPQAKVDAAEAETLVWGVPVGRPQDVAANAPVYLRRLCAVLFLPYAVGGAKLYRYDDVNPMTVGNRAYVVTDARKTAFVRHTPRRRDAWGLLFGAVVLAVRFAMSRGRISADWTAHIHVHQTKSKWERLFALKRPD